MRFVDVADAEKPWEDVFKGKKFDFIHSRMLCLGMHDWKGYFKNCFEHLEKGGWVKMQEVHMIDQAWRFHDRRGRDAG